MAASVMLSHLVIAPVLSGSIAHKQAVLCGLMNELGCQTYNILRGTGHARSRYGSVSNMPGVQAVRSSRAYARH
ncbi:hypothetical protein OH799_31360 [Nocardia sp. NBC_00881]|uniref:hypothetical protein n=1 Tax=Nocardia sp. NBC_00881 TaxID=2975995 RepID=UPI003869E031|nr:hypothetical protein OH799_31360 [Nocardia sp. NBC_00881]